MRSPRFIPLALAVIVVAGACSGGSNPPEALVPPAPNEGPPLLYVAIGASETYGIGADDPLRESWPHIFFRTALPRNTSFVNLGVPGATVENALTQELPHALELRPDIVTVWLNVNDMVARFPPKNYERNLHRLLKGISNSGAERVLVANTPPLEDLPAYRACRRDESVSADCSFSLDERLPPPKVLKELVEAYNNAIARAASRTGARVVDLHRRALELRAAGQQRELISDDGFHPSTAGHNEVAEAFADALAR